MLCNRPTICFISPRDPFGFSIQKAKSDTFDVCKFEERQHKGIQGNRA